MQEAVLGSSDSSDSLREWVMNRFVITTIALLTLVAPAFAGNNVKLNSKLDYTSDSHDGPSSRAPAWTPVSSRASRRT